MKKVTSRKVGKYTVVDDCVTIAGELYKTEELMTDEEIKQMKAVEA